MSWTREAVTAAVTRVIGQHTAGGDGLSERTELVADLGIDSLGVMEMVADLEDLFDLHIRDADLRDVTTLGDVVVAVVAKLEADGRLVDPETDGHEEVAS